MNLMTNDKLILAADVGGTKTLLALYGASAAPLRECRYENSDYSSVEALIEDFLEEGEEVHVAVFGVAAPILDAKAELTNLGWKVEASILKERFNIGEVTLLNDIVAASYALNVLGDEDLTVLQAGWKNECGNRALISPGTGLGEALVFVDGDGLHHPLPSEGGHVDFAPSCKEEIELYEFLALRYGHVSYERLISGSGLMDIYEFLVGSNWEAIEPVAPTYITGEALKDSGDPKCKKAVKIFVDVLAREAGNLALKGLATGGVYIGGGIVPKMIKFINTPEFLTAFSDKGRFKGILSKVPLSVITNPLVVVIGAFEYAKRALK